MALLSLSHVGKSYDGRPILDDVTLDVEKGRKIGVIGQNGCGKSTLLKILAGRIEPDAGERFAQRGVRSVYQAQELDVEDDRTVIEEMRRGFADDIARAARLRELEERLAGATDADQERLLAEYARLQDRHEAAGGWGVENRIETVLTGLGLPRSAWDQKIARFSGGERNVIALARAILADPDVLLLDEPSNHLDMDGLEWFTRFVRQTPAAVVMVSHNRHILDLTVDEIWEVRHGRARVWTGNYTDYEEQRAESLALQERQYKNQQRMIRRLEFQARRLRDMAAAYDDPGQAKRAKSMLKRIEMMDKVEKPDAGEQRFHARLGSGGRHGRIALTLDGFSFAYGERVIFEPTSLEIEYGRRVCLVGPNGCGKSTLFSQILATGSWENPVIRLGKAVKVGEYRQFHEDALDGRRTLKDWLQDATGLDNQPTADLLHRFLFERDDLDRDIQSLSGGEKSRLQLARLVHEKVNFLMLDEPTNHLDIQACEQLESMLEEFDGTLFLISHDRWFLDRMVDMVVEVRDRKLEVFDGPFSEWWRRHEERRAASNGGGGLLTLRSQADARDRESAAAPAAAPKQDREEKKARQREQRRLKRELETVEGEIAGLEARVAELETALAAAWSTGGEAERGIAFGKELAARKAELERAYAAWEDLAPRVEALEGD